MPTEFKPTLRAAVLPALLLLSGGAVQAQSSPWYLGGLVSVNHDSNILRLGEGQEASPGQSKSDTVTSTALVGGLDQLISRQRLQANATVRNNRFARNAVYNNESYSAAATLDWATVNRLSGQVTAGASRQLSTFNSEILGALTTRNFETTRGINVAASLGVVTEWSLDASAGTRRVRNSLDESRVQAQNLDQDDASIGIGWRPSGSLEFALAQREVRGRFPTFRKLEDGSFEDDGFRQSLTELSARWRASGASQLDLRLSAGSTTYERGGDRDFDSTSGTIGWTWRPTGKLSTNVRLSRDTGRDNYPTILRLTAFNPSPPPTFIPVDVPAVQSDLRTSDSLRTQLDWSVSAKVAATLGVQHTRRDVDGQTRTVFDNQLRAQRAGIDGTTIVSLGARWVPRPWSQLSCEVREERRNNEGTATTDLRGTSATCSVQLTLR